MEILEAMGWWYADRPTRQPAQPAQPTTCAALAAGTSGVAAPLQGVVVSSALADFSLLCLLPGERDGQTAVLGAESLRDGTLGNCPCCWRLDALTRAAEGAAGLDAAEAKALQRAKRWTGCRLWRRFAR